MKREHEGPVNLVEEKVTYGLRPNQIERDKVTLRYPGGSSEVFYEFNEYFSVHWTSDDELTSEYLSEIVTQIPLMENAPEGYGVSVCNDSEEFEMQTADITAVPGMVVVCQQQFGRRACTVSVDSGIGTFFWRCNERGKIDEVGVLTYDGGPHEPIHTWRNQTAAREIRAQDNRAVIQRIPDEVAFV